MKSLYAFSVLALTVLCWDSTAASSPGDLIRARPTWLHNIYGFARMDSQEEIGGRVEILQLVSEHLMEKAENHFRNALQVGSISKNERYNESGFDDSERVAMISNVGEASMHNLRYLVNRTIREVLYDAFGDEEDCGEEVL